MNSTARDVALIIAILAAIAMIAVAVGLESRGDGWFEVVAYWPVYVLGCGALIFALVKGGSRWLLLILPVFLAPAAFGMMLIFACMRGDCL